MQSKLLDFITECQNLLYEWSFYLWFTGISNYFWFLSKIKKRFPKEKMKLKFGLLYDREIFEKGWLQYRSLRYQPKIELDIFRSEHQCKLLS